MPEPSVGAQSQLPDTGQRNDIEPHSAQKLRSAARTRPHDCGLDQLSSSNNVAQPCLYSRFSHYLLDRQRSYSGTQSLVEARASRGADGFWIAIFHATGISLHTHEPISEVRAAFRLSCRSRTSDTA